MFGGGRGIYLGNKVGSLVWKKWRLNGGPNPKACALKCLYFRSPPQSLLDMFVEMEKRTILSESNLETLKSFCGQINGSLLGKIEDFEMSSTGS